MYAFKSEEHREIDTRYIYRDDFSERFTEFEKFMNFIDEREKNSEWFCISSKDIFVTDIEKESTITDLFRLAEGKETIIKDTLNNTGIMIMTERGVYPVRDTAIKTLLERAKINGTALPRLKRNVFAEVVNHCLNVAKGDALVKVQDEKISAVHGGDSCDYSVINMYDIFFESNKYVISNFPKYTFKEAYFDHSITSAFWELSNETELISEYMTVLQKNGFKIEPEPAVRVITSDVGVSGANIYPIITGKNINVVLGSPLKLNHKNNADIEKFKENLNMIFTQFTKGLEILTGLMDIKIYYPKNCMGGVMKRIGIPKKYSMEAIELFIAQNGDRAASAHDIFYGITEVLFIMHTEGEPVRKIIDAEENISRALSIKWKEYDICGDFNW